MKMWKYAVPLVILLLAVGAVFAQEGSSNDEEMIQEEEVPEHWVAVYKVSVTNITEGQFFGPILVATHKFGVRLFSLGGEASPQLEVLAETGDIRPLAEYLRSLPAVDDIVATNDGLKPGQSTSVLIRRSEDFPRISLAAMMLPTNDGFFALNSARLPRLRYARAYFSPGFDAGTEINDELCDSIPGPDCGGNGGEDEVDGLVHIHSGIHGIGHLIPARRDWRNPVARVRIRHVLVDPTQLTQDP